VHFINLVYKLEGSTYCFYKQKHMSPPVGEWEHWPNTANFLCEL